MSLLYRDHPKRSRRLGSIEREILEELSGRDLLYGFLLSGRSTRAMHRLARERAAYRHRRKRAIERLKDVELVEQRGERLTITAAGNNALGVAIHDTRELLKTQNWDHKWRIAAFDIPEPYASLRNKVRDILKKAGFVKLQHSVWIFPHECKALVQLVKEESALSKYILYGVLDYIEDENRLRKLFHL
ncbi:hypothetical protein HYW59_01965 [Candidatus Kaiserbacteria bacterium]|nr:hypothetical protein [Candidatus Kaiserbacteria bacterium]